LASQDGKCVFTSVRRKNSRGRFIHCCALSLNAALSNGCGGYPLSIGGGPDYKRWPLSNQGNSFYWEGLNKGKKSVALNLGLPEGRELALALATAGGQGAGVLVTNYPDRGFLSQESLGQKRPDIITARILGYQDGTSAVDYTANCAVGFPYMSGPQGTDDVPVNHVLPAWDLLTGSIAATAVLAAIGYRRRTGIGQHIRAPLSDVAASTLGTLGKIAGVLASRADRPKYGNTLFGAYGRDFVCCDGKRVMIVALTSKQWRSLIEALALQEDIAALEVKLGVSLESDEGLRFIHRRQIDALVEKAVKKVTLQTISERFKTLGVCFGPYRTLREALTEDSRFADNNPLFHRVTHPSGYAYPSPGFPASFSAPPRAAATAAPRLGGHTEEVLTIVLGLSSAGLAKLQDRGVIQL
jgi:2-methylfumaryl-CoA isomerase